MSLIRRHLVVALRAAFPSVVLFSSRVLPSLARHKQPTKGSTCVLDQCSAFGEVEEIFLAEVLTSDIIWFSWITQLHLKEFTEPAQ